jgi:hypothetical protein
MKEQRRPQQAVRVGGFERYMSGKDQEYGAKMALVLQATLEEYHAAIVLPLERRVAYLEAPVWRRFLDRVRVTIALVRVRKP